jgi:hypothetical protein
VIDLIEFIVGIYDAWYFRRIAAVIGAVVFFYFGVTYLINLPAATNFFGDLVLGFGSLALSLVCAIAAFRFKKNSN